MNPGQTDAAVRAVHHQDDSVQLRGDRPANAVSHLCDWSA